MEALESRFLLLARGQKPAIETAANTKVTAEEAKRTNKLLEKQLEEARWDNDGDYDTADLGA